MRSWDDNLEERGMKKCLERPTAFGKGMEKTGVEAICRK